MNRSALRTTGWIIFAIALAAVASYPQGAAEPKQVFRGEYDWNNGGTDELEAVFSPDGDGAWDVEFKFRFSGKNNTWKGTAEGSLEDGGSVSGTAGWDKTGRTWVFNGSIEDGVFSGTHAEVRGEKTSDSGTFKLTR